MYLSSRSGRGGERSTSLEVIYYVVMPRREDRIGYDTIGGRGQCRRRQGSPDRDGSRPPPPTVPVAVLYSVHTVLRILCICMASKYYAYSKYAYYSTTSSY